MTVCEKKYCGSLLFLLLTLIFLLSSCDVNRNKDKDTDTSDFESIISSEVSETDTDTSTESSDDMPPEEYYLYTDDKLHYKGYGKTVYAVYGDHAELISWEKGTNSELVVRDEIDEIPVTDISEDILNDISDTKKIRIFASSSALFAREFAIEHDCIFIELYDGSFPDHYYPYGDDPSVWSLNDDVSDPRYCKEDSEIIISDRSAELDILVKQYLTDGSGYDDIYEILLNYFAAAQCFQYSLGHYLPDLYIREYQSSNVDDYDKYDIYVLDNAWYGDNVIGYSLKRYDSFETYDEILGYADVLYTSDVVDDIRNANDVKKAGEAFVIMGYGGLVSSTDYADMEVEMQIEENAVLWRTRCSILKYDSETGESEVKEKTQSLSLYPSQFPIFFRTEL